MERIETTILRNLVHNEDYARKTIPFIQSDFFEERSEKKYLMRLFRLSQSMIHVQLRKH